METKLRSSLESSILNIIRRSDVSYADALSVIEDCRTQNLPKRRRIWPNTPRGKLLQRLFTLGPCRLVPDPHEYGWFYKGGGRGDSNSYRKQLDAYADEAEVVLGRLVRLQEIGAESSS